MGLFSKLIGSDGLERGFAEVDRQAREAADGGQEESVVAVRSNDFPIRYRLDVLTDLAVERLQRNGLTVVGVDGDGRSAASYIRVRSSVGGPSARSRAADDVRQPTPKSTERSSQRAGGSMVQRLAAALDAANDRLAAAGIEARAAACRLEYDELEVAIVAPGEDGLGDSLARLPGPAPIRVILEEVLGFTGKEIVPRYQNDRTWRKAAAEEDWPVTPTAPAQRAPSAASHAPNPGPSTSDVGANSLSGEQLAQRALKRWAGRDQIGVPFGPGMGLEEAVVITLQHLTPPGYLRMNGHGMCGVMDLIRQDGVQLEDWVAVLGQSDAVFKRHRIPRRQALASVDATGEAMLAVREVLNRQGPIYTRWASDDEFAASVFAIHTVCYLRLGAAGKIDTDHI